MPKPIVVRPREFFNSDYAESLSHYLQEQWNRAKTARMDQIDNKYTKWQMNYDSVPAQAERTLPWRGASNFVVQLTRMFIDTFIARSLNIVFATRPLYVLDFLPKEIKGPTEEYINRKAMSEWQHYSLTRGMLQRGTKNGTVVTKTVWEEDLEIQVTGIDGNEGLYDEEEVVTFSGPRATAIPFEDFYIYPITANTLDEAEILFHRVRMVEEVAVRRAYENDWPMTEEEIRSACRMPEDVKRQAEQDQAGVMDSYLRELHLVECHFKYDIRRNNRYYQCIALLEPVSGKIFDLYFRPYLATIRIFQDYRPAPREDFFYGDSWCQLIAQSQEEASTIHNDRRNASQIINTPIFKKKRGSFNLSPSTTWYPGKTFELDSMDDFEVVALGGSYNDMLNEENHIIMMCERLLGIGSVQQGSAAGMMGKRGIYNAAGTLAVLSESNQRQDTNIRDVRQVIGAIAKSSYMMQREYGTDDPLIDMFEANNPEMGRQIREGLEMLTPSLLAKNYFEIKASDAGANSEVAKANILQMAQVMGAYGASVPQMAIQLSQMKEPRIAAILSETISMQRWMAIQVLRTFGDYSGEQYLPDILRAFGQGQAAAANGTELPPPMPNGGGTATPDATAVQQQLASVAQVPQF